MVALGAQPGGVELALATHLARLEEVLAVAIDRMRRVEIAHVKVDVARPAHAYVIDALETRRVRAFISATIHAHLSQPVSQVAEVALRVEDVDLLLFALCLFVVVVVGLFVLPSLNKAIHFSHHKGIIKH